MILAPQYGYRLGPRNQREMRTLCLALGLLANHRIGEAADVLAQRTKALERSAVDGTWARACHLELIPSDGATLLDKDEEWWEEWGKQSGKLTEYTEPVEF